MTASLTPPVESRKLTMAGEFIARAPRGPDFIGPIWVPRWEREPHPPVAALKDRMPFAPSQWGEV